MSRNPDFERLVVAVEYKFFDGDGDLGGGMVEGYANCFNNLDLNGDVVEPGAFTKTIAERVKTGRVPFLDSHQWDAAHTIGSVVDASEDAKGLRYVAKLSKTPSAQEIRTKMLEGHLKYNSIGFDPVRESYRPDDMPGQAGKKQMVRHLHELKLFEVSVVPIPANEESAITGCKAVTPFQDLPLAARDRAWDAGAAEKRVREWAGGEDVNWTRYRRAFLWYDREKADELGSYKFPIADIVGSELTAIPRGIFAAAGVIQGARGGSSIPEADIGGIKSHLERYYEKMAHEFDDESIRAPWLKSSLESVLLDLHTGGRYVYGNVRKAADEFFERLMPEDRKRLLSELSAGPGLPPTEVHQQADSKRPRSELSAGPGSPPTEASDENAMAQLKRRALQLNSDLTRWRASH